jgi:hypothetical protein
MRIIETVCNGTKLARITGRPLQKTLLTINELPRQHFHLRGTFFAMPQILHRDGGELSHLLRDVPRVVPSFCPGRLIARVFALGVTSAC